MTTSFRNKPPLRGRLNLGTIALVVVALLFAVLLVVALVQNTNTDGQQDAGLDASSPSATEDHDHNHDLTPEINPSRCEANMTPEVLATFVTLVMDYEEAYQAPPSPVRTEKLSALTTSEYQASHLTTGAEKTSDTIVTLLRDKTVVACNIKDDGSLLASSLVVIQTSFVNDSGEVEIIYPELKIPTVHFSTWVLVDGVWKVATEE